MLSLESPTARMYRLAGFALHGERYLSLDEMVATVEGLNEDEVGAVAAEFLRAGAPDHGVAGAGDQNPEGEGDDRRRSERDKDR